MVPSTGKLGGIAFRIVRATGKENAARTKSTQNAGRPKSRDTQRWSKFSRVSGGAAAATPPLVCGTFGEPMDTAPV
jgi:hypothetical protein